MKNPAKGISWDLSDIYSGFDDPKIKRDKNLIKKAVANFNKKFQGKINESVSNTMLRKAIEESSEISEMFARHGTYFGLRHSLDLDDPVVGLKHSQVSEYLNELSTQLIWFSLAIKKISNKRVRKFTTKKENKKYTRYFKEHKIFEPFMLSESEEQIITKKNLTGADAFVNLYDKVIASTRFSLGLKGAEKQLTYSEIAEIFKSHADRKVRAAASESFTEEFKKYKHIYLHTLNTLLLDKKMSDEMRGYKFPQQATFLSYELDREIVDAMLATVASTLNIPNAFYEIKRKLMKADVLHEWDRYNGIYDTADEYSWKEAKELTLEAFYEASDVFGKTAELFFDNQWIDARLLPHKRSGAFCSLGSPSHHPYVLMNYTGQKTDIMTLAHELGHGIHAYLARQQPRMYFYPSTAVAEIASVFAEALVFDKLYAETRTKRQKISLLVDKLQGSFATIYRQSAFYEFEVKIHTHRREIGELSVEEFNDYFQKSLQPMFGSALMLTNNHAFWWMPILHFYHYNFYVFSYAFGEALTNMLYANYKKDKESFMKEYISALSLGGSRSPKELMSLLAVDISAPETWRKGTGLLSDYVRELEKLI